VTASSESVNRSKIGYYWVLLTPIRGAGNPKRMCGFWGVWCAFRGLIDCLTSEYVLRVLQRAETRWSLIKFIIDRLSVCVYVCERIRWNRLAIRDKIDSTRRQGTAFFRTS